MAIFQTAYDNYIKPWEGFYGWVDGDAGGETYGGISRVSNPTWAGWVAVDFEKHKLGVDKLKQNYEIVGLAGMVEDYYNTMFKNAGYDRLNSQDIANILFDFHVNSGQGNVEKIVGPLVGAKKLTTIIDLLNTGDQVKSYNDIKAARIKFYNDIVASKPSQQKFLAGWLNRINAFPTLSTGFKLGASVIIIMIIATVILLANGRP